MRPEILYPLFASVKSLPGVGPKIFDRLKHLCGDRIIDLIFHVPTAIQERRWVDSLKQARSGELITTYVTVKGHQPPASLRGGKKKPYRIQCQDAQGYLIDLIFFHVHQNQMLQILPLHEERLISGKFECYQDRWQMSHPDHVGQTSEKQAWIGVQPIYPLTYGLTHKYLTAAIRRAIKCCPALPEWIPLQRMHQHGWLSWKQSVVQLHHPQTWEDVTPLSLIRQRLTYDELFANQLTLLLLRQQRRQRAGRSFQGDKRLRARVRAALPYELTGAQARVLTEIDRDMTSPYKMVRLLQGDVGSGKTIVALLSMLHAVECGAQAALLAPTEILAQQHWESLKPWADIAGVSIDLLTSQCKNKKNVYERLEQGEAQIVVGTHALLQEAVQFHDLGLIIIDEQHRFGVEQRLKLSEKGNNADILVMTATPIPRTLMLSQYGDLDTSILDEKPAGRQEILTKTIPLKRLDEVIEAAQRALQGGQKLYWICPLVEESEVLDLSAATDRFHVLDEKFPGQVGLVHGRLSADDKEEVMQRFLHGELRLLVATTVIEVGVNVPDATIIVIEHAERFGLSQLHQMRGRVGRGNQPSTCLLLYGEKLTDTARARLNIMRETNDGFALAEEDLRLRGGGETMGWRQSGMPSLKVLPFEEVQDLLQEAHRDAETLLKEDPQFKTERGKAAKIALYLYEQDKVSRNLFSG